ncbi:DUF4255 domain-containing protein [Duganella sp. sic0402]|uniref:DUF4255 domain-containing protein n=1 Tax=Duganella sp. sic0402 TaxID=2854786 RepID=UPI001C464A08|nr:DUF4255 domain-containing protein [Duganella sp. sic0402]MBV7534721.1 DUF4255 domain-containing protein [Duganella sp. sic0402]
MSNIRNALEVICQAANEYMQNLNHRNDEWVVLSSLVDHDGSVNEYIKDKVVMTLHNITRDNTVSTYSATRGGNDGYAVVSPPIYVNLHLMFMANFSDKNYSEGLQAISLLLSFFQQRPYFTQDNSPDLAPPVYKLAMELETLGPIDVSYIMGNLGTKYLPSAFYKLRQLPFDAGAMQALAKPATGMGTAQTPAAGTLS